MLKSDEPSDVDNLVLHGCGGDWCVFRELGSLLLWSRLANVVCRVVNSMNVNMTHGDIPHVKTASKTVCLERNETRRSHLFMVHSNMLTVAQTLWH